MTFFAPIMSADLWFENLLLGIRTPFFLHLFNWITYLGNAFVIVVLAGLVTLVILYYKLNRSYIAGLATALVGAAASDYVLKAVVMRARPGGLIPSVVETSSSFPSWHATGAMAFYGFIAFMLCRRYPEKKGAMITAAAAFILIIGFSRLYLGVHFPSDVIGGYLLGGFWLLVGMRVTNKFQSIQKE